MIFDKTLSADQVADILVSSPFYDVALVGTMFTHGEGNDYDYVVLVPNVARAKADFNESGYLYTGAESGYEDDFHTFRKGDVNIMLTESLSFFTQFKVAAEVCKYVQKLTPLDKAGRIAIHRIIMNGEQG